MLSSIISSTDCWLAVEYASSSWPGFRELVEAGVGKALPRPEERADDEGVRSSSLEEVVCDGPSLRTEGGARGTTPDAFGGDTSFGAMVSIASFKRGAAAPFRHREPFGSNDKRGRGADLGGAGGVGGAARSLGQTWVPTEVFGDTPPVRVTVAKDPFCRKESRFLASGNEMFSFTLRVITSFSSFHFLQERE